MANGLYTRSINAFLEKKIDLIADTIKLTLIDSALYAPNLITDEFMTSVALGARISTATLSGKSVSLRSFFAANPTLTGIAAGTYEALLLWYDSGVNATSRPIAYIDTATRVDLSPAFPLVSVGDPITINLGGGVTPIFTL